MQGVRYEVFGLNCEHLLMLILTPKPFHGLASDLKIKPPFCGRRFEQIMPLPTQGYWTVRLAVTRRMPEQSDGDDRAVVAGEPSNGGRNEEGTMMLPTSGASRTINSEQFNHDPTDWVSVRIGHSLSSLKAVANLKNVVNDEFGEVKFLR